MIPLPVHEDSANVRALAGLEREDATGIVGATYTLQQNPMDTYVLVFKNGLLLHNISGGDYTVAGTVITFAVALVGGDKITVWYFKRPN